MGVSFFCGGFVLFGAVGGGGLLVYLETARGGEGEASVCVCVCVFMRLYIFVCPCVCLNVK